MLYLFNAILTAVLAYTAYALFTTHRKRRSWLYLSYSIASVTMAFSQLEMYAAMLCDIMDIPFNEVLYVDWVQLISIAFVLSGLTYLIYESKPEFARFPIGLCGLPLLIIPAYYFVQDTIVLKEWIIGMYEGGALLISALMYSVLIKKNNNYIVVLIGIAILAFSYVIYWIPIDGMNNFMWIWKSFAIIGILITTHGLRKVEFGDEMGSSNSSVIIPE